MVWRNLSKKTIEGGVMTKEFDVVIGLEIHCELDTKTKMFCACENKFGMSPNTLVCPVCLGLPGALPMPNKHAIELGIMSGLLFGSKISDTLIFERKNYFYPDLSKAYQISQFAHPLCVGGGITLDSGKYIRLDNIHIEEDAGKLVHEGDISKIDYNRGGVPLIECVTCPDLSSKEETVEFLQKFRDIVTFGGVSKCKMQEGGMRVDVNISVKEKGSKALGVRTELKNLSSFRSVSRAIDFESARQMEILLSGGEVAQETRRWDENENATFALREKSESKDYRYFPDPDILPIKIDRGLVERLKSHLPSPKAERIKRYEDEYGLPASTAEILTSTRELSDFYDECVSLLPEYKEIANWIMSDLLKFDLSDGIKISPKDFVEIVNMVVTKKISRLSARDLLDVHIETGEDVSALAGTLDLMSVAGDKELEKIIDKLIFLNPVAVADYAHSPDKVLQFFVGGVMKETYGKADGEKVKELVKNRLKKR